MEIKNLKVLSLFSGAGGLDYGFKSNGFEIIGSVEIMKEAVETHNYNFGLNSKPIDLTNEDQYRDFIEQFKEHNITLLLAGFPCQGYSMAGKRNPNDKRNQLYKIIVRVINDLNIPYFVLENVPGILNMNNGEVIKEIEQYFKENGLHFQYDILDSSKLWVPQKRKRVIFIGAKQPKSSQIKNIRRVFKMLTSIDYGETTSRDWLQDLENKWEMKELGHIFTKHKPEMVERIKGVKVGKSLYENFSDAWRRIDYDKPSPTIKENHGGVHIHPVKNRVLTPRELARLQSFPDGFLFKGSKKAQLIQIGNAVPVNMSNIIAHIIKKHLIGE